MSRHIGVFGMKLLLTFLLLFLPALAEAQTNGVSTLPTEQNLSFFNQNSTPSCALSTTTGSIPVTAAAPCVSSASKGVTWNLVGPLTGNATLAFPSGLIEGTRMGFYIQHGSGGFSLSFAPGYYFPAATVSGNQPTLTNTANAEDLVVCQAVTPVGGSLGMRCETPSLAMAAVGSTITGMTLSAQTFPGGSANGTAVGTVALTGSNNGAATLALSGPDAPLFQLSGSSVQVKGQTVTGGTGGVSSTTLTLTVGTLSPGMQLTGGTGVTAGTIVIDKGTVANTYMLSQANTITNGTSNITAVPGDGLYHLFITPTLAGAPGSGVKYPFEVAGTVTCNSTVSTITAANITTAISSASGSSPFIICLQGSGTFTVATGVTAVAVNKAQVRITGVNQLATSGAWYSNVPQITLSGQGTAFAVSANSVTIDHLRAFGASHSGGTNDTCTNNSQGVADTSGTTGLTIKYNHFSSFMCDFVVSSSGTTGFTYAFNWTDGNGYVGIDCDPCFSSLMTSNINQNAVNGTGTESNNYPMVIGGDAVSTSVLHQFNAVENNPVWECFDNHGSTDISWFFNYCLAAAAANSNVNTAINVIGGNLAGSDGAQRLTRGRANNNTVDLGTVSCSPGCFSISMGSLTGDAIICTGGDGNGCQLENNNILGMSASSEGATALCTNTNGCLVGTTTGTLTISGNTSGAAATMAAPTLTTDQPSSGFVANQANGVIGAITVTMTPSFPSYVGGWPNYGGWPGTFQICEGAGCSSYASTSTHFAVCVDGQHICQAAGGTAAGTYTVRVKGILTGLSNAPQNTADLTLTGS